MIPFSSFLSSLKERKKYKVFGNYDTMDDSLAGIILYVLRVSILNCEIVRAKPFQYHTFFSIILSFSIIFGRSIEDAG